MMNKLKVFISMLAVVMGIGFATTTANAQDITSQAPHNIVDNLKFAAPTLNQGEISSLTVTFSEKKEYDLKAGDTLKLKLPEGIKGLTSGGKPTTMPLQNGSKTTFANAVVTGDEVVITFTNAVEDLDNIRGYFNIAIVAENQGREDDFEVSPLNMGLPEKNAAGKAMNLEGLTIRGIGKYVPEKPKGEFQVYKTGDMMNGLDNVRWFINLNPYLEVVDKFDSKIVIKDTMGPGQKLSLDSFMLSSTTWNDATNNYETEREKSLKEVLKEGWVTATIDEATGKFEITIDTLSELGRSKVSGKRLALSYISDVTDSSLENFTNTLDLDYKISNRDPVKTSTETKTKNMRIGGGADGDGRVTPPTNMKEFENNGMISEPEVPEEETTEDLNIDTPDEGKATETTEPEDDKATETDKPEILNDGKLVEEVLEEEQLEILDDIIQEHIEGGLEEGHTHEVEIDGKPEILTDEEIIDEILTPEQKDELKDVIERDKEKQKPEVKPVPEEEKPEVKPVPEEEKPEVKPVPEKEKPEVKPVPEEEKPEVKPVPEKEKPEVKPVPEKEKPEVKPVPEKEKPESKPLPEKKNPEILNDGKLVEEVLEEEQLEILDDIIQEHIEGGLEEGHTHEVEIDGKLEILTDEEILDGILTPEQKAELKDVIERDKEKQKKKSEVKPAPEKKKSEEKKTESTTEVKKAEVKSEDKSDDEESLPETGYKNNVLLTLAGLLVAAFGVFFYKKTR